MPAASNPGLGDSQATHREEVGTFCTIQVSHSHVPRGFLNMADKELLDASERKGKTHLFLQFD